MDVSLPLFFFYFLLLLGLIPFTWHALKENLLNHQLKMTPMCAYDTRRVINAF